MFDYVIYVQPLNQLVVRLTLGLMSNLSMLSMPEVVDAAISLYVIWAEFISSIKFY